MHGEAQAASPKARQRPGGRSERIRTDVAQACLELLAEGKLDLPLAEVASRSGVSRPTIYRWWPNAADRMDLALSFHTRRLETPDTGTWGGDVNAFVDLLAEFLADPIERAQNSILASGLFPDLNEVLLDYFGPITSDWRQMVVRAIERGEVPADTYPDQAILQLVSPLLVITVVLRRDPTADEVRQIAQFVIRATKSG